tara:strand:+ start:3913 stop:4029 length:117 start_codon:yes stop_codon:yes gene_type:complete
MVGEERTLPKCGGMMKMDGLSEKGFAAREALGVRGRRR